jgi:hypothetical protein
MQIVSDNSPITYLRSFKGDIHRVVHISEGIDAFNLKDWYKYTSEIVTQINLLKVRRIMQTVQEIALTLVLHSDKTVEYLKVINDKTLKSVDELKKVGVDFQYRDAQNNSDTFGTYKTSLYFVSMTMDDSCEEKYYFKTKEEAENALKHLNDRYEKFYNSIRIAAELDVNKLHGNI